MSLYWIVRKNSGPLKPDLLYTTIGMQTKKKTKKKKQEDAFWWSVLDVKNIRKINAAIWENKENKTIIALLINDRGVKLN